MAVYCKKQLEGLAWKQVSAFRSNKRTSSALMPSILEHFKVQNRNFSRLVMIVITLFKINK
jgi:hypothetical protein